MELYLGMLEEGLTRQLVIAAAPLVLHSKTAVKADFFFFPNSIFIRQFITQGQLPYKCSCLSSHRQQLGAGDVSSAAELAHVL